MPNKKMTKSVKKKPGKIRNFINSIIFNRETPRQGRKRKNAEKQNLTNIHKQEEYERNLEFKRGGKLWSNKANQYD